jgi:hypothetical protein
MGIGVTRVFVIIVCCTSPANSTADDPLYIFRKTTVGRFEMTTLRRRSSRSAK